MPGVTRPVPDGCRSERVTCLSAAGGAIETVQRWQSEYFWVSLARLALKVADPAGENNAAEMTLTSGNRHLSTLGPRRQSMGIEKGRSANTLF